MINQILDVLENSFVNINPGQKQIEIINQLINKNLNIFNELSVNMFKPVENIDEVFSSTSVYIDMWQKNIEDTKKSSQDFINTFGLISVKTNEELIKKYETLKNQCDTQKDTIKQLQNEKIIEQKNELTSFKNIIEKQSKQFQDLVNLSEKLFTAPSESQKSSNNANNIQKKNKPSVKNKK